MNRGFRTYYKEGIHSAFLTLKKKENFIKYYLHLFMNLFGRILFALLSPAFDLSNVRLAKMVRMHKKIEVSSTFESTNKAKTFWTTFISSMLIALMFLAGTIMILVVEAFIVLLGLFLTNYDYNVGMYFIIFLSIPVVIGLIIYFILFPLYFAPLVYVVDSVEDVGASVAVVKSIEAMKHNGKKTFFAINFVTALINLVYLGFAAMFVTLLFSNSEMIVAIIGMIIFVAGYIIFAPVINLGSQVACVSLFEDIVFDKYNENKVAKGVYVKSSKTVKATVENYQDKLVRMFDDVEEVDLSLLDMDEVKEVNIPKPVEEPEEVHKIVEFTEDDLKQLLKDNEISLESGKNEHVIDESKEKPVIVTEDNGKKKKESIFSKIKVLLFGESDDEDVVSDSEENIKEDFEDEENVKEDYYYDEYDGIEDEDEETEVEEKIVDDTPVEEKVEYEVKEEKIEEPVVEEPVVEEPVVEEPVVEEKIEEPVVKEETVEEPKVKKTRGRKPKATSEEVVEKGDE